METSRIKQNQDGIGPLAIGICHTGHNTHVGIVHRDLNGTLRFLNQGFHFDTTNDLIDDAISSMNGRFLFAVPDLEVDRAKNIAGMCRLIARYLVDRRLNGFAYALRFDEDARFDQFSGELALPNGVGLSCSTFVIVIFRSAKVRFIDFENWPTRPGDAEAQTRIVNVLERWQTEGRAAPEHVEKVRSEIGCVRARPEELAGICMLDLPGRYPAAERAGEFVLSRLQDLAPSHHSEQ